MTTQSAITIPTQFIGPIQITGDLNCDVSVPLSTFESPMWPSTNRGASVSRQSGGIKVTLIDSIMTRSVVLEGPDAFYLRNCLSEINTSTLAPVVETSSRYAKLDSIHTQIIGKLLFVRLSCKTGDASGHNMVTKAADSVLNYLLQQFDQLSYVSISGNLCVDKKASAINGILGRGKSVVAEITIPESVCKAKLKTTAEAICALNIKKNLIGSIAAGGIRTANAHFANLLLAFYLATGQDAANIVEGSQGIVYTENQNGQLYFSVTIPNIIVGTVGNGKDLPFVQKHLALLGCNSPATPGKNAERLALICAATVLCGELSLLAAQSNPGELMRAHQQFERGDAQYQAPITAQLNSE